MALPCLLYTCCPSSGNAHFRCDRCLTPSQNPDPSVPTVRSCPLSCAGSPRTTKRCGSGLGSARGRRTLEGKGPRRHTIAATTLRTSQGNLSQRVLLVGCANPRATLPTATASAHDHHVAQRLLQSVSLLGPTWPVALGGALGLQSTSVNTQSTLSQHPVNIQSTSKQN